jgi:nucleoid-associated protein YgaU
MMDKAKIINLDFPLETVIFNINPSSITINKQVQAPTRGTGQSTSGVGAAGSTRPQFSQSTPQKIQLKKLYIEGLLCKPYSDIFLHWMTPWGGPVTQAVHAAVATASPMANVDVSLPMLMFQWGPPVLGFVMKCQLTNISMEFTRFSPLGTPTRMLISQLELTELWDFSIYALTNPTSGGKPGRSGHVITEGENLQQVSQQRYGRPQHWRALAEANGIDDPLRVRAGDNVYLPSVDEVISSDPPRRPALPRPAAP